MFERVLCGMLESDNRVRIGRKEGKIDGAASSVNREEPGGARWKGTYRSEDEGMGREWGRENSDGMPRNIVAVKTMLRLRKKIQQA